MKPSDKEDDDLSSRAQLVMDTYVQANYSLSKMRAPKFIPWMFRNPPKYDYIQHFRVHCGTLFALQRNLAFLSQENHASLWGTLLHPGLVRYSIAASAAKNALKKCLQVTYDPRELQSKVCPILHFLPDEEYSFHPVIKMITMPPSDLPAIHMWPALAHEVFHAKIDRVNESYSQGSKLGRQLNNTIDRLARELRDKTAISYSTTSKSLMGSNECSMKSCRNQIEEALCDYASLRICGTADLLRSFADWIDICSNPRYDVESHISENPSHPPHIIRLRYMSRYYDEFLGYSDLKDDAIHGFYAHQYDRFMQITQDKGFLSMMPNYEVRLMKNYDDFFLDRSTMSRLDTMVKKLIYRSIGFSAGDWRALSSTMDEGVIPDLTDPLTGMNYAWIIRLVSYIRAYRSNRPFDLRRYDRALRRMTPYLKDLYFSLARS